MLLALAFAPVLAGIALVAAACAPEVDLFAVYTLITAALVNLLVATAPPAPVSAPVARDHLARWCVAPALLDAPEPRSCAAWTGSRG